MRMYALYWCIESNYAPLQCDARFVVITIIYNANNFIDRKRAEIISPFPSKKHD